MRYVQFQNDVKCVASNAVFLFFVPPRWYRNLYAEDRVVVGHALENDFDALQLRHPPDKIRDTAGGRGRPLTHSLTPHLVI